MNRSGNILLSAVEPMADRELYLECDNGISIAWTLGHLACVHDLFGTWLGADGRQLASDTHHIFNSLDIGDGSVTVKPSKAASVDPALYPKARLIGMFRSTQVANLRRLERFDPARWREPVPPTGPDSLPTLGAIWESLGVHTYWHLGELSGCHPSFKGTYTLNTVLHYFYVGAENETETP